MLRCEEAFQFVFFLLLVSTWYDLTLQFVSFHLASSALSVSDLSILSPPSCTRTERLTWNSPLWDFTLRHLRYFIIIFLFFFFCRNTCRVTESGGLLPAEPSGDNPHTLLQAISDTLHRVPLQLRARGIFFLSLSLKSVSEVSPWFSTFEIQAQMLSCHFIIRKFLRNRRQVKKSGFIA